MKIIINGNHAEKLTDALETVQARCSVRTLCADEVEKILETATRNLGVSKKAMVGTKLLYTGAQHFPSSYKYQADSTHFTAEHNGRHWVVTSVTRKACPNRQNDTHLTLSEVTKTALIERFANYQS